MLFTIGVMALAVSLEPFRIGMTVLMLNRPKPLLQLLAFVAGGFAMGLTVGATVLFVLRRVLLRSTYFTLPRVQILIGALALAAAAGLAVKIVADRRRGSRGVPPDRDRAGPAWLTTRLRRLLDGRSLWVAAAAGLGIALPSVDYLAALAVILASGAPVMTQLGALLMFNVIAFSLVEIPLVAYLLAPTATRAAMTALQDWIRSRRRIEVAALLVAVGLVLLAAGLADLDSGGGTTVGSGLRFLEEAAHHIRTGGMHRDRQLQQPVLGLLGQQLNGAGGGGIVLGSRIALQDNIFLFFGGVYLQQLHACESLVGQVGHPGVRQRLQPLLVDPDVDLEVFVVAAHEPSNWLSVKTGSLSRKYSSVTNGEP